MTQDELNALPEDGGIGYETITLDGKTVMKPCIRQSHVLYQPDNEPMMVTDLYGHRWILGYYNGVLHKRRFYY